MTLPTRLGGTDFIPGSDETITYTFSPTIDSGDTIKLRVSEIEITGSLDGTGTTGTFVFTATESGSLPERSLLFGQVSVNTDERVDIIEFQTGAAVIGSTAKVPDGKVISISAGSGISVSPDPITSTGTITATGTVASTIGGMDNVDSTADSAADGSFLVYSTTSSEWEPGASEPLVPEPGTSNRVTLRQKAWSVEQSALVSVTRETFYQETGGSGTSGDVTVLTGVEQVVKWFGWTQDSGNLKKYNLPEYQSSTSSRLLLEDDGDLILKRGSTVSAAADGYLITVEWIASV